MSPHVIALHTKPSGAARLPKTPIAAAVVDKCGVRGDYNHYRHVRKKDTPDRALLVLTEDVLAALNAEGHPVRPGDIGENVLITGLTYGALRAGQQLAIGAVLVELTEEARPCRNLLKLPYGNALLIKALRGRRGWFARAITPGTIRVGDVIKP